MIERVVPARRCVFEGEFQSFAKVGESFLPPPPEA